MAMTAVLLLGIAAVMLQSVTEGKLQYTNQTLYNWNKNDSAFITKCVYDNAEDLICYYEVSSMAKNLTFIYTFGNGQDLFRCPRQTNSTCEWLDDGEGSKNRPKPIMTYYMFFVNASGNQVSRVVRMKPLDEFKPSRVSSVETLPTNTSLTISWDSPLPALRSIGNLKFLYCVKLYHNQKEIGERNTTEKSIIFKSLDPYANYSVDIKVRNDTDTGHWSESYITTKRTEPGLATANPEVAVYYWLNATSAKLIWKPLSADERRGPGLHYEVVIHENETETTKIINTDFSSVIKLNELMSYVIEICAIKSFGRNVTIPASNVRIPFPRKEKITELIPVLKNSDVTFYWSLVANASKYKLFWCEQESNDKQGCKTDLLWGDVLQKDLGKKLRMNLTIQVTYNFAIAAFYPGTGLGPLTWSSCTYYEDKEPKKPQRPFRSNLTEVNELHVEWKLPTCSQTGFILNYIVHYCIGSDCSNTEQTMIVDRTESKFETTSVQPGYEYDVWVEAKSPNGKSFFSEKLAVKVETNALSSGVIASIVICAVIAIGLVAFVVVHFFRTYKKKMEELQITLPEKEKLQTDDSLSYDYLAQTQQIDRPDSRNSDNSSNARREGFESRTLENLKNEYVEQNMQDTVRTVT